MTTGQADVILAQIQQPVPKNFSSQLKSAVLDRLEHANSEDKSNAEELIMHLCAKISSNDRVFTTFKSNLGNAVVLVTQILGMKLPITAHDMYYLVPYGNTLQIQVSYYGMLEIAYRAGLTSIVSQCVYEGDIFEIEYNSNTHYSHRPNIIKRGNPIGYYVAAKLNGDTLIEWMTIDEINIHKGKFSKSLKVWTEHFDSMARKTLIKKILRIVPKTPQVMNAIKLDDEAEIND